MPAILIIDDEKAIRNVLKEILANEGFTVEEANDGEEGLKKFTSGSYDVVLCDIKMPKLDGIEFLQKVTDSNSETPVIMIRPVVTPNFKVKGSINAMVAAGPKPGRTPTIVPIKAPTKQATRFTIVRELANPLYRRPSPSIALPS